MAGTSSVERRVDVEQLVGEISNDSHMSRGGDFVRVPTPASDMFKHTRLQEGLTGRCFLHRTAPSWAACVSSRLAGRASRRPTRQSISRTQHAPRPSTWCLGTRRLRTAMVSISLEMPSCASRRTLSTISRISVYSSGGTGLVKSTPESSAAKVGCSGVTLRLDMTFLVSGYDGDRHPTHSV